MIERIETLCSVSKDGFAARAGEPLVLRGWQKQLLLRLFARRADGRLRHRVALIGLPRKNGKSAVGSALALDGLLFGGRGAEVYSAAAEKEQARIVFGETKKMITASPDLTELCNPMRDVIEVPATGSIYRVLSAEAYSKEGLNISRAIVDELHAHPTDDLWNVLTLASAARVDPMVIAITTAGVMSQRDGRDTVCYRLWKHGRDIAEGLVDDPSFFMAWWGAPDGADHTEPDVWQAANPGFGDLIDPEDFASAVLRTPENEFRTKRLNQWVAAETAWLPAGAWDACLDESQSLKPGDTVFLGFDGSKSGDTTVIVAVKPGKRPFVDVLRVWDPSQHEPGYEVPLEEVEDELRAACRRYQVREILCDEYRWVSSLQKLAGEGLPIVGVPQTPERLIPMTERFYEAVMGREVAHGGNQVLARHLRSATVKMNERGVRIVKETKTSTRRIDAAVAAIMAFYQAAGRRISGGRDWLESLAPPCPRCDRPMDRPGDVCSRCDGGEPVEVAPERTEHVEEPEPQQPDTKPWNPWSTSLPPRMPDQTRAAMEMLRNLPPMGR